jgi:hypothetical protein
MRLDSNQRKLSLTDLQSAPFSHSGTHPQGTADYRLRRPYCQIVSGMDVLWVQKRLILAEDFN